MENEEKFKHIGLQRKSSENQDKAKITYCKRNVMVLAALSVTSVRGKSSK